MAREKDVTELRSAVEIAENLARSRQLFRRECNRFEHALAEIRAELESYLTSGSQAGAQ